jgi:acetolactate synthase I/II/III large subunit
MKVSDYIADFLEAQGVRCIFEIIGGMITHMVDSVHQRGKIRLVSMHHEQAAAFAAGAAARMTGVPGVAMATSGPGAINLLTGVADCYFDSAPAMFITGQVNRDEQKGSRGVRQLGFQETSIVPMALPVTKAAWKIASPDELLGVLSEGIAVATSGRPGPVLLDIPMDIQRGEIDPGPARRVSGAGHEDVDAASIEEMLDEMTKAERPLLLVGGGIRAARAAELLRIAVPRLKIPVVHSLMGMDALPYADPLRVGMIGTYGNRWANSALGLSDLLVVLGSRLDVRQTGSNTEAFRGGRKIYHVDCDTAEMNNRVAGCRTIVAELAPFLQAVSAAAIRRSLPARREWAAQIAKLRAARSDIDEQRGLPGINPNEFMHQLSAASRQASAFVVDVGQHQMWAAQSLELTPRQRFLTSGGCGAMGFALPAAVGVAAAVPGESVVMIAGDGGFQLNIQELETISHHRLPVKMIIIDNKCYGMLRQFQDSYFDSRYASSCWGYSAPSFESVAKAYGIDARTISEPGETAAAIDWLWEDPSAPRLLSVSVDIQANAFPKIAFGRPITEMEPSL